MFVRFALLLAAVVALPLVVRPVVASEIWIFAIAAMALNLIFGYTGMLSFGQATFFGLAAYTAGLMMIHWQAPLLAVLAAGTLVGALAAALLGYVCIQRVGTYFIMLTFGFNQMFYFIAYKWTSVTGGDDGLPGIPRPPLDVGLLSVRLDTSVRYYAFVAVAFLVAFYAMKRVVDSPLGVIFRAIRENPGRAAAVGYDVKRYKWLAFTIAGGFTGVSGVLYSITAVQVSSDRPGGWGDLQGKLKAIPRTEIRFLMPAVQVSQGPTPPAWPSARSAGLQTGDRATPTDPDA